MTSKTTKTKTTYEVRFTFTNDEGFLERAEEVVTMVVPSEEEKKAHNQAEAVIRDKYGSRLRDILRVSYI